MGKFCEGKVVRVMMVLLCFNGANVSACFGIPSVKVAKCYVYVTYILRISYVYPTYILRKWYVIDKGKEM